MMDTLYFGGDILTMDHPATAEAVAVTDGVIRRVGTLAEVRAGLPGAEMVDLRGHTLMPAFLDPHSHLVSYAASLRCVQLSGADNFAEIERRLAAYVREKRPAPGAWVIGTGYDHNLLAEKRHPDKRLLDRAAGGHPVLISHASGHMGVASSAALEAMGIGAGTPDPDGGRIGRTAENGEPDGYLEENAFFRSSAVVPGGTIEEQCALVEQAQREYFRQGIATIQEGRTKAEEWAVLRHMADAGRLAADVVAYVDQKDHAALLRNNAAWLHREGRLRLGGYKIFLDGSPQGRTAWLTRPYEKGEDGYRGYPIYSDRQVTDFVAEALGQRVQILAHCNGDAAAAQFIAACRGAEERVGIPCRTIRPVMIHAQTVRPDQLREMAALGIIPSFFIAHTYYWGDIHIENLGMERASAISPARSAGDAGLPYTFHQDTPVLPPDMLRTVWCAVNRLTREGVVIGEAEKVTPLQALRAVTIHAAYQYFDEDRKGTIRPGKLADFVVLGSNPLKTDPMAIDQIPVLATIRNGHPVYTAADWAR